MILNENHQLYKGVFWIVDQNNVDRNRNYCFVIPSDCYGNVVAQDLNLNAKSGTTYNHERLWRSLPRSLTHGKSYNYFPRGRVEIQNEKATIYLNPLINTEEIRKFLIDEFNLTAVNGIRKIILHSDGSVHYRCHLDD